MIRSSDPFNLVATEEFAAVPGQPEIAANQGLGGSCAEADDNVGFDHEYFSVKPRSAGLDLARRRFFVQTTLATGLPTKVLYDIGNVDVLARYPGFVP